MEREEIRVPSNLHFSAKTNFIRFLESLKIIPTTGNENFNLGEYFTPNL